MSLPPPSARMTSSSPLSSLDSMPSSDSFFTAVDPDRTITDMTSPEKEETEISYRKARELPANLKYHIRVFLESDVFDSSLRFLQSLLSSGQSGATPSECAFCAPPNQLALLSTLAVHPQLTSRLDNKDWADVAPHSMVYLRDVLKTFGAIRPKFKEAFRFESRTSRLGTPDSQNSWDTTADVNDEKALDGYGEEGVWRRAPDFFVAVGWTFNCSVLYPNRWAYWKPWLEFMLDVLRADLIERFELDRNSNEMVGKERDMPMLRSSILAGYIDQRERRMGGYKWIIKSIFADGSLPMTATFKEVWPHEHRGPPRERDTFKKRKRGQVDIEKGEYGTWLDNDNVPSSQSSATSTPQKPRGQLNNSNNSDNNNSSLALNAAFCESIQLRQRLFKWISFLAYHLPQSPIPFNDLYDNYAESLKSLSIPLFNAHITSSTSELRDDSQITIFRYLADAFMPKKAVRPSKIDPAAASEGCLTYKMLLHCFLPHEANTVLADDQAKLSLLLEEMIMMLWTLAPEEFTVELREAVEKGIEARCEKAARKGTRTRGRPPKGKVTDDADAEAVAVLEASGERLRLLVDMIEGS